MGPLAHSRSLKNICCVNDEYKYIIVAIFMKTTSWKCGSVCVNVFHLLCFSVNQVRYWNNGEEESSSKVKVPGNETSTRLRGLKSNLAYYTAVRAYNSAGAGPFSTTVNATTKKTRT